AGGPDRPALDAHVPDAPRAQRPDRHALDDAAVERLDPGRPAGAAPGSQRRAARLPARRQQLMRRRGSASIAANPVLIGAATTLVVIVAVFLAYNANNGLPFVPSYSLKVNVPSAANLVKGNEVRLGGTRVGVVDSIEPVRHRNGIVTAQLGLKLETTVKPLPIDSTVIVRPRSALGLKYVELTKGTSQRGWPDGSTVPLTQARPRAVEIDEVLNMFDDKTRAASRVNLKEFGDAFAGRGQDLNIAIEQLNPLLT